MLNTIITSKKRVSLLNEFFLITSIKANLRQLFVEFVVSTNSVLIELNRLKEDRFFESYEEGNIITYQAKESYPLYLELISFVSKIERINKVVEDLIQRLVSLYKACIV